MSAYREVNPTDILAGANIRRIRHKKNLTLEDVAARSGISLASVAKYELGKQSVSLTTIAKLCLALKCKPASILRGVWP